MSGNQIDASFIDILRIKWLALWSSFFRTTSTVASSEAPAVISPHPVEQTEFRRGIKDMDYKSVFTNLCLELQQNRSWIKGLGKNPQKSELIHWRQCLPGAPKRVPSDSENTGVYTRHPTFVTATRGVLTRLPASQKRNACAVEKKNCLRREGVKPAICFFNS